MEMIKRRIPVGRGKCRATMQLTVDDDFNVPDRKPDVRQIVASQGEIHTNEVMVTGEKAQLDGVLQFQVLYIGEQEGARMQGLSGEIPFREWVNFPESCQRERPETVLVRWILEDLSVEVINSRKISVRAIVTAQIQGEESETEEVVTNLLETTSQQCRRRVLNLTQQRILKKDVFRVREEYVLPSSRPDMEEIVYQEVSLRGVEVRLMDDKFSLKGELHFLVFYYGVDSDKLQYLELELPFSGLPECIGCEAEMIADVEISILKRGIQIKPDEDGEERILDLDVTLELSERTYGEEALEVLEDCYGVEKELVPVFRELELQELSGHYSNKLRLTGRIQAPEPAPAILQLCGTSGVVRVDESLVVEEGIHIEGVIELPILYITAEDAAPVYLVKGLLPFEETIRTEGLAGSYEVRPVIDQVALTLLDGRTIDAKATLNLETYLFRQGGGRVVIDCEEREFPEAEWQRMPGLIGCYVQPGDSWWTLGRKYRVPVDSLQAGNEWVTGEPEPGMRLLIRKKHLAG